jgi:hypothetical protein
MSRSDRCPRRAYLPAEGDGFVEAEDEGGVLGQDGLAILLEPPGGGDAGTDARADYGSDASADHGSGDGGGSGGGAEDCEGGLDVVAAEDGAFAVDAGGEVLVGVDDLGVDEEGGSVGEDEAAGFKMEGGGAVDAAATVGLGDAAFELGSGGDEDAAIEHDGFDDFGGEGGSGPGIDGGDGLVDADLEEGADGGFVVGVGGVADDVSVDVVFGTGGAGGDGLKGGRGGGLVDGFVVGLGGGLGWGLGRGLVAVGHGGPGVFGGAGDEDGAWGGGLVAGRVGRGVGGGQGVGVGGHGRRIGDARAGGLIGVGGALGGGILSKCGQGAEEHGGGSGDGLHGEPRESYGSG